MIDPAAQYRAELDFEITFSNGGSLRGEGFRIDIAGPGLTEDELGAALIADLGLLMADRADVTSAAERGIGPAHFIPYQVEGRAVLVRTGWDRRWGSGTYAGDQPFLTAGAAAHLVRSGARLVGIDASNIDDTRDPERPVHSQLLAAGIPVCEHLTNLGELPGSGFRFSAVPPRVAGFGTFPVRAYATWEAAP